VNSNELMARYGVWPRRADDPLRLGRRRRKRGVVASMMIGAALCTLIQEKASAYPGHQMLQSFVAVKRAEIMGIGSCAISSR
jgi:hypothetical protein